ncbi:unnamed protein product [Callosobruchus maculatus]|uniref:Palmitoyltransferase n=2 Tax=Callosobruchus maculatus TaxID=64391 RepID=A0A653BM74_CALMS|nr:unnamed protein product [Callosobruchus maculatus]
MSKVAKCLSYVLPVLLLAVLISSYVAYIHTYCAKFLKKEPVLTVVLLVVLNILFLMLVWALLTTVSARPKLVPEKYKVKKEDFEAYLKCAETEAQKKFLSNLADRMGLVLDQRSSFGMLRFCSICLQFKPDRAHHCSHCGVCLLKMDHHCPWIANCVGLHNQKAFILTVLYTVLYCSFYVGTTMPFILAYFNGHTDFTTVPIMVGFAIAGLLGTMAAIFYLYHCSLVFRNETTLEEMQRKVLFIQTSRTYNLGFRKNFIQVFGRKWYKWFLPIYTSEGDGCTWETKESRSSSRQATEPNRHNP